MTDHLMRKAPAYQPPPPPLQSQQVIDPDDEVKVFSELFKETADDMTCNDSFKIYQLEGTPYISHSTSFSDLRDLPHPVPPRDSSPQEETVKIYQTEDTPYCGSYASSISDLTGISGHHSLSENNNSALASPRPEPNLPQAKLFSPAVCASNKLTTVHEDILPTPLICSRSSPLGSISDEECDQVVDENGSVCSEFSRRAEESEVVSPSDLPESPGELEPPAKRLLSKATPPPVPPKPMCLLLKLQSRRSDSFVPPPTKFQDAPPLPHQPAPSPRKGHDPVIHKAVENAPPNDESDDGDDEDDDLDDDNEFFTKCLELGLRARSSVAVPKSARPESNRMQCSSSQSSTQNQKQNPAAIAEVEVNGNNSSDSDSESGEEDEDGDYAFIRMYMERGLRIDATSSGITAGVRSAASPPPPPLPAKRKTVKPVPETRGQGIGTKEPVHQSVPSRADSGSSSRSGSRAAAVNVPSLTPLRSPAPASPAVPDFQSSDPKLSTATSPASSSCSLRKPYLETDIDSIVNYEMFLKSINSAASGIHSSC